MSHFGMSQPKITLLYRSNYDDPTDSEISNKNHSKSTVLNENSCLSIQNQINNPCITNN